MHVGVLIGANCVQTLEPSEFTRSKTYDSYTYKTKLGWCIVGPIGDKR